MSYQVKIKSEDANQDKVVEKCMTHEQATRAALNLTTQGVKAWIEKIGE
ncbi:hypothetical protein [Weissella minor]